MTNLETHDMIGYWIDRLGLSGWTITTEAIDKKSVTYAKDVPDNDRYFVGIKMNKNTMYATIYHDRPVTEEDIIHELLHIKHQYWSEDKVNKETARLLPSGYSCYMINSATKIK